MPLMKSKSKKAFEHNVKAEMKSGKPQDQALAIAYDIKRRSKKKKMASGGSVESGSSDMNYTEGGLIGEFYSKAKDTLKKTMEEPKVDKSSPDYKNRDPDPKKVKQYGFDKYAQGGVIEKDINDKEMLMKQKSSLKKINQPRMVESSVLRTKLREQEDNQMSSMKPDGGGKQPPELYNEEQASKSGNEVPDMEHQHNNGHKVYFKGGHIQLDDAAQLDKNDNEKPNSSAGEHDSESSLDHEMMEQPQPEANEDHEDSIAAAIMSKKERQRMLESDSDIDKMVMMAEGGYLNGEDSIYSDDSDQADLSRNAEEDMNLEDQASFDAMRKENYSESEGLEQLASPKDSNLHGNDIDSDRHDMVSQIRNKMNKQRQFKVR